MASFYGTTEDFDRFLMPRIRNKIQTLARPLKSRSGGACEQCGRKGLTLEAAHVHGCERKTIVREVLEKYHSGDGYHIGDLDVFESEVVAAHEPVGETFLFLCRDCHRAYDDKNANNKLICENTIGCSFVKETDLSSVSSFQRPSGKSGSSNMGDEFYDYLVASGYTEFTKSGKPGTAYSYKKAVDRVCGWESIDLSELPERIEKVLKEYSPGGTKANYGKRSHKTVINALRAFARFCATREYHRS